MPDFIPRRDADAVRWLNNFAQQVLAEHETIGVPLADAEALVARQAAFAQAYQAAMDPSTRTASAIRTKDDARAEAVHRARLAAGIVASKFRGTPTLVRFGLRERSTRKRIPRPADAPWVHVVAAVGAKVTVQLRTHGSPARRGLPRDVKGAEVFAVVSEDPPTPATRWAHPTYASNARITIDCNDLPSAAKAAGEPLRPGTKVWLTARWSNYRGETGPASEPIHTYTAAGMDFARDGMRLAA